MYFIVEKLSNEVDTVVFGVVPFLHVVAQDLNLSSRNNIPFNYSLPLVGVGFRQLLLAVAPLCTWHRIHMQLQTRVSLPLGTCHFAEATFAATPIKQDSK